MKRFLAFFLSLWMVFSLVSCSASLTQEETKNASTTESSLSNTKEEAQTKETKYEGVFDPTGFSVGFARNIITPKSGTPMAGYGNTEYRLSSSVLDPLYATCVAVSDGENTALFYSLDLIYINAQLWRTLTRAVTNATGIPKEYMFFTCTHTHSGPEISGDSPYSSILIKQVVAAAKEAIATRDRAEMYIGETRTENLAYVRRYIRQDGTAGGGSNNVLGTASPLARHETDADNQMQIIRFDRANQKDIVLVNWTCHVTTVGSSTGTEVSADWVGVFRKQVEKETGMYFAYYQGAAGNVTPGTKLSWEKNNAKDYEKHGEDLAATMIPALSTLRPAKTGKVQALLQEETVFCDLNIEGYDLAQAQEISDLFSQRKDTTALCRQYGYSSAYHANAVIARSKRTDTTIQINFGAIAIGDVAFAAAPYEMFDTNGMQVKKASSFPMTFLCAYTNGAFGYIPSIEAFPNRGYEVDTTRYVPGTGEQCVRVLTDLLDRLLNF